MWQRLLELLNLRPSGQGVLDLEERVKRAEDRAHIAEVEAGLKKRLRDAEVRTKAAGGAPKRGLGFWVLVVGFVVFVIIFVRSC